MWFSVVNIAYTHNINILSVFTSYTQVMYPFLLLDDKRQYIRPDMIYGACINLPHPLKNEDECMLQDALGPFIQRVCGGH